jgi:hypothetical protein
MAIDTRGCDRALDQGIAMLIDAEIDHGVKTGGGSDHEVKIEGEIGHGARNEEQIDRIVHIEEGMQIIGGEVTPTGPSHRRTKRTAEGNIVTTSVRGRRMGGDRNGRAKSLHLLMNDRFGMQNSTITIIFPSLFHRNRKGT